MNNFNYNYPNYPNYPTLYYPTLYYPVYNQYPFYNPATYDPNLLPGPNANNVEALNRASRTNDSTVYQQAVNAVNYDEYMNDLKEPDQYYMYKLRNYPPVDKYNKPAKTINLFSKYSRKKKRRH